MGGATFMGSSPTTGMVVGGARHGLAWTTDEEKHYGVAQVMILVSLVEGYSSYMVEFTKKLEETLLLLLLLLEVYIYAV
jgi:hypothetical protein